MRIIRWRREHESLGECGQQAGHLFEALVGLLPYQPFADPRQDVDDVLLVVIRLDIDAELIQEPRPDFLVPVRCFACMSQTIMITIRCILKSLN